MSRRRLQIRPPPALPVLVERLGTEIASCQDRCSGIKLDRHRGIMPRGLMLEPAWRGGTPGAFVVGSNLGLSKADERGRYQDKGCTFAAWKDEWNLGLSEHVYYRRLRGFMRKTLDVEGPLLWSDVAKCEGANPPQQTLEHCSGRFLSREIESVPEDWLVVGASRDAYDHLRGHPGLAGHRIVGILHPSGNHTRNRWKANLLKEPDDDGSGLREPISSVVRAGVQAFDPAALSFWVTENKQQFDARPA